MDRMPADNPFPTPSHTAAELIPPSPSLPVLRKAAAHCTACPLHRDATQTVFGEGPARATWMLIGETPGDQEDLEGRPFVGPSGKLLDRCLSEAGLDRSQAYVTNAVKHFKFEMRGKRRLHKRPNAAEMHACYPWLEKEIGVVKPRLLVCLGATAAQAILGRDFKVTQSRGKVMKTEEGPDVIATVHPSSILRARGVDREEEIQRMIADLKRAAKALGGA